MATRRGISVALLVALLAAFAALGFGVAWASGRLAEHRTGATPVAGAPAGPRATPPSGSPSAAPAPAPPAPTAVPAPQHPAPVVLLRPGDDGPRVRSLQARLRQIQWFAGDVTDHFGPKTEEAVRGFQAKRGLPVTGLVDTVTMARLERMTRQPSADELANRVTPMGNVPGRLNPRCLTGRVLCIDKQSRTLRWVVDGQVRRTLDVRFGSTFRNTPTREGVFHVYWKDADHLSQEFGSAMPYSMFFSGGQAVHYSSDFAARGYAGASHGCVNVRDYAGIRWLFGQVHVGDAVVVYWS